MKNYLKCLYKAADKTVNTDGIEHAGYMSFMVLFSIFPFLVFFLALTSFFGASELGNNFIQIILENLPEKSIESISARVNELAKAPPQRLLTLAIVGSIWTASSFVEGLRTILNKIYEVKFPPPYIRRRLLSIAQFLIISLLISLAMLILVVIPWILGKFPATNKMIEGYEVTFATLRYLFILVSLFFGASSLYYIIPNVSLKYKEIVPGAILTVLLWVMSGYLLSKYIIYYNQLSIVYGSLGSIIITLLFFYIINVIFIYGAAFNKLIKDRAAAKFPQSEEEI